MKIRKKISIGFLMIGIFGLSFGLHKYYISLTSIDINTSERILEMSIKVFADDLNQALKLPEGTKMNDPKNEKVLMEYFKKCFFVKIDGKPVDYNLAGTENDADLTWIYLQAENCLPLQQVTITNTILTEVFSDQINMIYMNQRGETQSEITDKGNPTQSFEIKK
jgi:hypothetical protein